MCACAHECVKDIRTLIVWNTHAFSVVHHALRHHSPHSLCKIYMRGVCVCVCVCVTLYCATAHNNLPLQRETIVGNHTNAIHGLRCAKMVVLKLE